MALRRAACNRDRSRDRRHGQDGGVLTVGLIGQDAAVAARRCRAFPDGASIAVRELTPPPETWTDCQLVIAVASEDAGIRAAADVGIDDAGSVWRETLLLRDWLRADPVVRAEAWATARGWTP